MLNRRKFVSGAAAVAAGSVMLSKLKGGEAPPASINQPASQTVPPDQGPFPPGEPGRDYTPVITPNNISLPWKVVDGVKVYHLIAEPVRHEFAPGLVATCWGYNGRVHGPTIEAVEGDRVRIYVTNKLPAPTSVHWHGILLPNGMDGVAGLNQKAIDPGETYRYEFTLRQHGTHFYHSHHDEMTQIALGMMGLFIIHPRNPKQRPDRDFALMLGEWRINVGASRPDPNEMTDFNIFTFNAKAFPGTEPLVAKLGDRVRIRLANSNPMDHHPIHLHGYQFPITETDGGPIPPSAQQYENTVLTPVGTTRTIDFVANAPGDWAMHCHMTHHTMNQMGHAFGNFIGVNTADLNKKIRRFVPGYMAMGETGMGDMGDMGMKVPTNSIPMVGAEGPFSYIAMGGMFTIFKVREGITTYQDPGWYKHPPGTVASVASAEEIKRDGIDVEGEKQAALRNKIAGEAICEFASTSFKSQTPFYVSVGR
jgi:FtsP/CotA-like multicopper oxidase with cupredoxin domain